VVLDGGHVMQIDTPMRLYERPKNTFVAAFIGSPSMNLLPGAIIAGTGISAPEFRAADDTFSLTLSGEWAERLAGHGGRSVILGIRPEDIVIAPGGSARPGAGTVRVRLDVVEPLGSEAFLSARVGAKEITARVPPRGLPAAGSEVELVFNRERLHFFDGEGGETIANNR
jgi:multiple sugar transport system ATP-binding protein